MRTKQGSVLSMLVWSFLAGLIFVATLLALLATFKNLGSKEKLTNAQEEARRDTYSGPMI
jgi:hypothetical protein